MAYLRSIRDPKERLALSCYVYIAVVIIDKKYNGSAEKGIG